MANVSIRSRINNLKKSGKDFGYKETHLVLIILRSSIHVEVIQPQVDRDQAMFHIGITSLHISSNHAYQMG